MSNKVTTDNEWRNKEGNQSKGNGITNDRSKRFQMVWTLDKDGGNKMTLDSISKK